MTTQHSHSARLATGLVTVLLAIPLFGLLLWGSWRLLFWGVVATAPHARSSHATGIPAPGAMPPGVDTMLAGSGLLSTGVSLTTLVVVGFLALVAFLLVVVAIAEREADTLATLEEAYVHGELSDDEFVRRRRALTEDRAHDEST